MEATEEETADQVARSPINRTEPEGSLQVEVGESAYIEKEIVVDGAEGERALRKVGASSRRQQGGLLCVKSCPSGTGPIVNEDCAESGGPFGENGRQEGG